MLSASCSHRPAVAVPTAGDAFAALVDFATALPGVVLVRDRRDATQALRLQDGDALGPADAFFSDGSFARHDPARGALDVVLPEPLWRRAIQARLARLTRTTDPEGTAPATRLEPPCDAMGRRALAELVEGAWAYARGL